MGDETKKTSLSASELWKMEEFRMKMKKMLAILAALSVLGTTGLTVGAEDTATTTESATEAITTTETEAETTAAETTAETETETTVETAAAEENQTVKEEGTKKVLTSKTIDFGQHTSDPNVFTDETLSVEVYYLLNENEGPVYLSISINGVASNLTGIVVKDSSLAGDPPSIEALCNIDNYFKQSGENSISINVCGTWTEYDYVGGQFVTAGGVQTTTTTTENTTTTTTTIDPAETEEALLKIFEEYVAEKQAADESGETGGITSFCYDAAAKKAYGVYGVNGSMHSDILCIITKDGVVEQSNVKYGEDAHRFKEAVCFTNNGSTFVAAIVDLYSNGGTLYALNIYNVSGNEPLRTNLYKIYVGNVISPYGYPITDPNSSIALDDYFTVKSDGVITVNGVDYTYDTASAQFVKVGDSDSGKTDNGSASNAPATKGTSSTPKTGDMTTVPAVAVGLTLTAAGVVAFISKRKK